MYILFNYLFKSALFLIANLYAVRTSGKYNKDYQLYLKYFFS